MSMEREIKLALPASQVQAATQWFAARAGKKGRAIKLVNIYFDTPQLTLASSKSALRLRQTPDGWLQTFKTVGTATNGLHSRHEWEMPVAGAKLEIDSLLSACDEPAAAAALKQAAPALIELFHTNFTRTLWLLDTDGAQIEAAIDQGDVLAEVDDEARRAPISEIELELKSGDEAALHTLAAELGKRIAGLAPDDISKAQRGYRLRAG
ncbi:triphosphatase [Paraburkholderia atlantica]|uniref:Inorganic triphosphatase YgiF n=1 Tax=Paraburkholderia atlantica TaxID=2654982 RepID=A0A6I1Q8I0_PARAM|nr:CYTH domain-containing protein [Paraburkholderia atlantica]MBB5420164.1 inorganic triphosphatase YgiF [Paraburkholderia atlantica]MBB5428690.1 inorganic triphosphatase YgiF [Paraburkholderia atlantica]MPW09312.1 CYTH domain-containing protein [Paraburkholderia atlantica]NUY32549.1 CYTH domain-containing protein [Paraburkholderia atlantica]